MAEKEATVEVKAEEKQETVDAPELDVLTPEEQSMGERFGLIKKRTEQKAEDKKEGPKGEQKPAEKTEDKKPEEKQGELTPEDRRRRDEDATRRAEIEDDPEKEAEKLKTFNFNERKLYFLRKRDRGRMKSAETERDFLQIQNKAMENRLAEIEEKLNGKKSPDVDADGNPLPDPDDQPLTPKRLKEIEQQKQDEARKRNEEQTLRAQSLKLSLASLENEAKARYEDFDKVMELTTDILKNGPKLFAGDQKKLTRANRLIGEFFDLASSADKARDGEYNAADAGYEIGLLHPNYRPNGGRSEEKPAEKKAEAEPSENARKMDGGALDKAAENANRRSSASVAGNGTKVPISEDEITPEMVRKMSVDQFRKLKPETRERLLSQ